MQVTELETREVTELETREVTVTRYILTEKVFDLKECPDWAQYAAVDEDGTAYFYMRPPSLSGHRYTCTDDKSYCIRIGTGYSLFDATDWWNSLIERPKKVLEVTMSNIEKKYGCKVKLVREE